MEQHNCEPSEQASTAPFAPTPVNSQAASTNNMEQPGTESGSFVRRNNSSRLIRIAARPSAGTSSSVMMTGASDAHAPDQQPEQDKPSGDGEGELTPQDLGDIVVVPPVCSVTTWLRALRAVGVIFGDIGTSPLYTISSIYCAPNCYSPLAEDAKGVFSNIVWSLILITTIKYIIVLLSNMHQREGGIFALLAQTKTKAVRGEVPKPLIIFLTVCAVFGSCALIADGIITPALSVLSAIAGFEDPSIMPNATEASQFNTWVPWITAAVLLILYALQFFGTSKVGITFGPGCMLYFFFIGGIGLYQLIQTNGWEILAGFSPHYAVLFWTTGNYSGSIAFSMASSVVLAVTGSEAIYADGGHFGQAPVVIAWFGITLPCVLLSYAGQLALSVNQPSLVSNPYFYAIPSAIYIPGVIISLFATLVASQAMISGCFSLISQAINLDLFPPVRVVNTDPSLRGQIYVPIMNIFLCILCISFVLGFQTSAALANAYGMSVLLAFNMTAILLVAFLYYVKLPKWPLAAIIAMLSPIIFVEVLYLASTFAYKIGQGGWAPLIIAAVLASVMLVWRYGRSAEAEAAQKIADKVPDDCKSIETMSVKDAPVTQCTCVFLCRGDPEGDDAPLQLQMFESLTGGSMPARTVLMYLQIRDDIAFVRRDQHLRLYRRGDSCVFVAVVTLGFADLSNREEMNATVKLIADSVCQETRAPERETVWFVGDANTMRIDGSRNYVRQLIMWTYTIIASVSPRPTTLFEEAEDINFVNLGCQLSL